MHLHQVRIRLALKPGGDIAKSPKQGFQWPLKKDSCPPKIIFKKTKKKSLMPQSAINRFPYRTYLVLLHNFLAISIQWRDAFWMVPFVNYLLLKSRIFHRDAFYLIDNKMCCHFAERRGGKRKT